MSLYLSLSSLTSGYWKSDAIVVQSKLSRTDQSDQDVYDIVKYSTLPCHQVQLSFNKYLLLVTENYMTNAEWGMINDGIKDAIKKMVVLNVECWMSNDEIKDVITRTVLNKNTLSETFSHETFLYRRQQGP